MKPEKADSAKKSFFSPKVRLLIFIAGLIWLIMWIFNDSNGRREFEEKILQKIAENNNSIIGIHLKDVIDFEADKICISPVDYYDMDFSSDEFQNASGFKTKGSTYIAEGYWAALYLDTKNKKIKSFIINENFSYPLHPYKRFHCSIDKKFKIEALNKYYYHSIYHCMNDPVFKEVSNDDPKNNSIIKTKCILTESEN